MNVVEPPSTQPSDDLDGLLRAFFRRQMPHPWPTGCSFSRCLGRASAVIGATRLSLGGPPRWLWLLLGSLLLSGRFTGSSKPGEDIDAPTIGSHDIPKRMEKEHKIKEHENKNKIGFGADDAGRLSEPNQVDMR